MGTLQINTLGTSFAIESKEDSSYLQNLLAYFNQVSNSIENSTELKDPIKIAILTGIMLSDELYKEKKKNATAQSNEKEQELFEAERITLKMINEINKVL